MSSLFSAWGYRLRYAWGKRGLVGLHQDVFDTVLRGMVLSHLEEMVAPFLQETLSSSFYIPVLSRLRVAQHLGQYTVVMSSSPTFLVKAIAEWLGVDAWAASEYATDGVDKLVSIAHVLEGTGKAARAIQMAADRQIKLEETVAYTDSFDDLPLLRCVGHPVVVNPDMQLRRLQKKKGWELL